ncbi:hypothetical protein BC629DRAFT_497582 [Irpex lacteus]|nr:hypothetical protein BC629DRAFT_497582 [Irpex lacteus]
MQGAGNLFVADGARMKSLARLWILRLASVVRRTRATRHSRVYGSCEGVVVVVQDRERSRWFAEYAWERGGRGSQRVVRCRRRQGRGWNWTCGWWQPPQKSLLIRSTRTTVGRRVCGWAPLNRTHGWCVPGEGSQWLNERRQGYRETSDRLPDCTRLLGE